MTGLSCVLLLIIYVGSRLPPLIRDWLPFPYVSIGYFASGLLFIQPAEPLESWLLRWDRRLLGDPTRRFSRWPWWLVGYLEVLYMLTFLLIPGGFAVLQLTGHAALADHYWSMVLAADLLAFASLSVFQTRPPWALERKPALADAVVHRFASSFVKKATIGVNTFPSGHVAVSFVIAIALAPTLPFVSAFFFAAAVSISVACVVGRYHYVVDVLAGLCLAVAVWMTIVAFGI